MVSITKRYGEHNKRAEGEMVSTKKEEDVISTTKESRKRW